MIKKLILLVVLIQQIVFATDNNQLFNKANELYKDEKYEKAIEIYRKIEKSKQVSSELYYNLANANYKLNKVAWSIYYFEKALQLNPMNFDARNNLVFAKRLTLDRIEELPKTFLQRIDKSILQKLSFNGWSRLSIVFSIIVSVLFILFYKAVEPNRKRLFFITSIMAFLLMIITYAIAFNQYEIAKSNKPAIVFVQKVEVKNSPTQNSEEVFTLHEGTKVNVLDQVDNWKKIKLADGKIGWLLSEDIKEL